MTTALPNVLSLLPGLSWLTGPIFEKELRVSSRRRRNYVLRSAYIVLLGLFIIYVWLVSVRAGGSASPSFQASRMSVAGRYIITTIIWFQFVTAQLIAVVMLSTSISDEIRQRTLGVLMTTPINSLQIVMGKLLSGLLQVTLLLAISLPLLAIIRVFGGVPWGYVVSSLCITLSAAVFLGSLSLLLSMTFRHAYNVVMVIIFGYLIAFAVVPPLVSLLSRQGVFSSRFAQAIDFLVNPFGAMLIRTYVMLSIPRNVGVFSSWPLHCAIMLSASVGVVCLAIRRVRGVALTAAFGGAEKGSARKKSKAPTRQDGQIKRLEGSPVVWKEMRKPFFQGNKTNTIAYIALGIIVVAAIVSCGFDLQFGTVSTLILASILMLLLIVRMAILSAASITREKESRTWPILLATPLDDWEIVRDKGIAAIRRNLPMLFLIVLLLLSFCLTTTLSESGPESPMLYVIGCAVTLAGSAVFVIGLGLYCSARMKRTSAAVAVTLGAYMGIPFFCCGALRSFSGVFFMLGGPGSGATLSFLVPVCVQTGVGLLFAWRAKCRVRRNIF